MYIITGGAGFIGSAFASKLNRQGIDDIVIVDELASSDRWKNLRSIRYADFMHKDDFLELIKENELQFSVDAIIHMGACSSTTERDGDYMMKNNFSYTKHLADFAVKKRIRFIYASSAASYGDGAQGYSDDEDGLDKLRPLNVYGYSKQLFDVYAKKRGYLKQIVGLKFFNVFGPNEYHKEDMRSMVLKSYLQIKEKGVVKLFRSDKPNYGDGEQKRDFVYVKDCCDVMWWLLNQKKINGIFNLGSGKARSWNDLVKAVYAAAKIEPHIQYIDMPDTLKKQYQYFTEAQMGKLAKAGCPVTFRSLEDAVSDYVNGYLSKPDTYL